jgi:peptidoglycan/xylan/chitin deacetylase (PgdA/CDA1 family)
MTRWDWTWEERVRGSRTPTVDPDNESSTADGRGPNSDGHEPYAHLSDEAGTHRAPDRVFRRRRAGAGLVLLMFVLLIGAIASHRASNHTKAHPATRYPITPAPSEAEQAAATVKAEQRAVKSVLAYTPAIRSGGSTSNEVALTFDDGPGPYTTQVVSALDKLHVHATFFTIGSQERYFSAGTIAEIRSGEAIGDHTETHPMMARLSPHDQYEQLFDQMAQIELMGGMRPQLFRPPYGSFNATTFRELHHLHLLMVLWSVDTADYTLPGVRAVVRNALAGAKPGAIILMHDGGGNRSETIAALPAIVAGLRRRGLRPVTVPRLLMDDPPPHGLPLPTSLAGD